MRADVRAPATLPGDGEQQRPGAPPALPTRSALTRRPRVDVVLLAAERHHHLAALADDLATDATILQHKPSARLPVVITRCRWCDAAAGCGVRAVGDVWRFDRRRATPTERLGPGGDSRRRRTVSRREGSQPARAARGSPSRRAPRLPCWTRPYRAFPAWRLRFRGEPRRERHRADGGVAATAHVRAARATPPVFLGVDVGAGVPVCAGPVGEERVAG